MYVGSVSRELSDNGGPFMHLHRGVVCVMQSTITADTADTLAQKGRNRRKTSKYKSMYLEYVCISDLSGILNHPFFTISVLTIFANIIKFQV